MNLSDCLAEIEFIAFSPAIDISLTIVVLLGFLLNFHFWVRASANDPDSVIDLKSRLPRANIHIVLFCAVILLTCWIANLAVWSIFVLIFAFGVMVGVFGGPFTPDQFGLLGAAAMLREWCFGFPNLILDPKLEPPIDKVDSNSELIGRHGTAVSQLRPTGEIEIDGKELTAISEDGKVIQSGAEVLVTSTRMGRIRVRRSAESPSTLSE